MVFIQLLITVHSNIVIGNALEDNNEAIYKDTPIIELKNNIIEDFPFFKDNVMEHFEEVLRSPQTTSGSTSTSNYTPMQYYFGKKLNEFEKKIYLGVDKICQIPITSFTTNITDLGQFKVNLTNLSTAMSRVKSAFRKDHGEYWWNMRGLLSYKAYLKNNYVDTLKVTVITTSKDYSISFVNTNQQKVINKAKSIVNGANRKSTVYEKIQYIHDYLVKNIKYDAGNSTDGTYYTYHSIYGALINGRSACLGYAEAFKYITRLAGIESIVVEAGNHAWNYVKIGTKWYAIDVTFDDPVGGSDQYVSHTFFLVGRSNKMYKSNHESITSSDYPTLSTTDYKPT